MDNDRCLALEDWEDGYWLDELFYLGTHRLRITVEDLDATEPEADIEDAETASHEDDQ